MEAGYQFKDHEVRKLLEEMLEGESFEILTKVEQRQVLKVSSWREKRSSAVIFIKKMLR